MSVPAIPPTTPRRPKATQVPDGPTARVPGSAAAHLREALCHVLAGLRYPARRWEIIAEADSWGVGGPVRQALGRLPDGSYPSLSVVLDVLTGPAARPGPDRVVVPMRPQDAPPVSSPGAARAARRPSRRP